MPSHRVRELVQAAGAAGDGTPRVQRLCLLLADAVPVSGVGLSVTGGGPGRHSKVAATDGVSGHIEDLQVLLGQGPCVDAVQTGEPVLVPDLTEPSVAGRWPMFTPAATEVGARASFAVPLIAGDVRLGAIDLYRDAAGTLDPGDVDEAQRYAAAAVEVLLELQRRQPAGELAGGVTPGWAYTSTVHQATGMVMVQLGSDVETAFTSLRARAFRDDRPLQDVARDVLDRRLRFDNPEVSG